MSAILGVGFLSYLMKAIHLMIRQQAVDKAGTRGEAVGLLQAPAPASCLLLCIANERIIKHQKGKSKRLQCSYTWPAPSCSYSTCFSLLICSCCCSSFCLGKYTARNVQRATCNVAFALAQTIFGLLLWPMRFVVFAGSLARLRPLLGNCVSARGTQKAAAAVKKKNPGRRTQA